MHMFGGMALAAVVALLVVFLIIYPLLKWMIPKGGILIVDVIMGVIILGIGIGLIATTSVHLILMGIFLIAFGGITLHIVRKSRVAKQNKMSLKEYISCKKCGKHYYKYSDSCPYC